jgi:hypothetical protein
MTNIKYQDMIFDAQHQTLAEIEAKRTALKVGFFGTVGILALAGLTYLSASNYYQDQRITQEILASKDKQAAIELRRDSSRNPSSGVDLDALDKLIRSK